MAKTYKYLLDTHIFLWWMNEDERLSDKMCQIIEDGNNIVLLSVASVWEISIKQSVGKLKIPVSIEEMVESSQLTLLNIELPHISRLSQLPMHHKDPFDRVLIAQANVEKAFIVSNDQNFKRYDVDLIY